MVSRCIDRLTCRAPASENELIPHSNWSLQHAMVARLTIDDARTSTACSMCGSGMMHGHRRFVTAPPAAASGADNCGVLPPDGSPSSAPETARCALPLAAPAAAPIPPPRAADLRAPSASSPAWTEANCCVLAGTFSLSRGWRVTLPLVRSPSLLAGSGATVSETGTYTGCRTCTSMARMMRGLHAST